jgi:predicted nucleic acid-binding protein
MLRVYLDTNVYCRPRDDRTQERIEAEALAFEEIAGMKEAGEVVVITSDYVKMELKEIDDPEKREDVMNFERAVADVNYVHSQQSRELALALSKECGLGILDSLHLAAAALSGAECFFMRHRLRHSVA